MTHLEEGFTFTWNVENFSMLPHQKGEFLRSPTFVVDALDKSKWCVLLYPKGDQRTESDNCISLFLENVDFDENKTALTVRFTFIMESVDSALEKSVSSTNGVFDINAKCRGFTKFLTLDIVSDNKNMYLPQDVLTIRCRICSSQEKYEAPAPMKSTKLSNCFEKRCSARTGIEVQRRSLTWPITKINELEESREKVTINLVNSLEDSPELKLSFYVDEELSDEYAQIEILQTRSSKGKQRLFVKCKVTVVNGDKCQFSHEDSHLFSSNLHEIWHFPEFILIYKLTVGDYSYVDNTMFLQCEFTFLPKGDQYHLELPMYMPDAFPGKEAIGLTQLSSKIGDLFESEKFCDVELRCGEKKFPCHRLVLCAQSPVFSAMFDNDMKEKETGVVEITDLDPPTLQNMLKYLYSEVVEDGLSSEEICHLYSAADKYEVEPLQRRCSLLLLSTLSLASVRDVLVIADTHCDYFLQVHVNNFLSMHSRKVFRSPQWKAFMVDNPILSRETMIKIFME